MHSSTFPISPLAVIQAIIVSSTLASPVLLLALVLALQPATLAALGIARRWGPPRRTVISALLAGSTRG